MGGMLPPGPREPAALQTVEWIARPTTFLRRSQARHGEPFTVNVAWADAPMVLVSDPESIRRVFTAGPDTLQGGSSSTVLEPFAGPSSILVLSGAEHLRQRRLLLPPFHGDALDRWRDTIAALARAEVARWAPGVPLRTHARMQDLTLDVILRVVFGARPRPQLRAAIRRALGMTQSLPRLVAMSLVRDERGPWGTFMRAVRAVDAVVKEVLRVRPVLSIAARRLHQPFELGGHTLPAGVHVAPCIYLAHRRREAWGDPTAFRPERFLEASPAPYTYLPFGGGVRRCAGAAFATLEMREVLRAVSEGVALAPARPGGERMRRGSVTLVPRGGGTVMAEALQPSLRPCRSSAATTA